MNEAIKWLYQQYIGSIPQGASTCYLCGGSCYAQHTVAKGIAETFNSHYLAACPSSSWLCSACWWYFNDKMHPDFRKMSLIVGQRGWRNWQRSEMKEDISEWLQGIGNDTDLYLVISLSKKKHILLQAPMNVAGSSILALQVEEQVAHLDYTTWEYMDRRFMALLKLGHNKGEILSGNLYGNTLRKHGELAEALYLSQQLDPYRNSPQLELLSYVTIMEERTADGSTTGNGDDQDSGNASESRMDTDQPRVQEQVQDGHLEPGGNERGGLRPDVEHAPQVSEPTLWEV
jgi:hypothetical protein